ncbi:MAG: hypothetical protein R3C51_03630 [Parvularculaceae bacterium]
MEIGITKHFAASLLYFRLIYPHNAHLDIENNSQFNISERRFMQVILNNNNCGNLCRQSARARFLVCVAGVNCKQCSLRAHENERLNAAPFSSNVSGDRLCLSAVKADQAAKKAHDYKGFKKV